MKTPRKRGVLLPAELQKKMQGMGLYSLCLVYIFLCWLTIPTFSSLHSLIFIFAYCAIQAVCEMCGKDVWTDCSALVFFVLLPARRHIMSINVYNNNYIFTSKVQTGSHFCCIHSKHTYHVILFHIRQH